MFAFLLSSLAFSASQTSFVYRLDGGIGIWVSGASNKKEYTESSVSWSPSGYSIKQKKGYQILSFDGGVYYSLNALPESVPVATKLEVTPTPKGYSFAIDRKKTSNLAYIKEPNGKKSTIYRGKKEIKETFWIAHEPYTVSAGAPTPDDSFGWEKSKGVYSYKTPPGATPATFTDLSPDDIATRQKEIRKFAPTVKLSLGKKVNLDNDTQHESLLCGKGIHFDSCYIYDHQSENYYPTFMTWNPKEPPQVFRYGNHNYIMYKVSPKSRMLRVLYFSGTKYNTVFLRERPKRKR